jgi:uncharacterized repeat protein (TIGR01451 family)
MWICCNEKLFKKLQIFGGAKRMTQLHRFTNNSKFKTTGDKIMKTNSNNTKFTVKTIARTWIFTPILSTSFLIGTSPAFATIDNTATVTGTYSGVALTPAQAPPSNTVSIPVASATPKLSVAKSVSAIATVVLGANNSITDAGDTITYQYIVTNNGNVTINSVKPVDVGPKFGTAQVAGTGTMGAFSPAPVSLMPGQAQTFTATYTLSTLDVDRAAGITLPANAVNNSATATGTPVSGTLAVVPPGTATTTITAGPRLTISKAGVLVDNALPATNTTGNADAGEIINYTYTVFNSGNVPISNVSITDSHEGSNLPAGTVKNEVLTTEGPLGTPASTDSTAPLNNGVWTILQPGATITFTYAHTVTQGEVDGG